MPALYGVPAGPPTAGATSGIGGDLSNVDEMISSLMSRLQMPQEQPVKQTPLPKKILGGIADALMARAQVLAGQAPSGAGVRERQRQEEEGQRQRNEQIRQERTTVQRAVTMDVLERERQKGEKKRQEDEIARRQALDDQRASEAEVRRFVRDQISEMAEKGLDIGLLNPATASVNDVLEAKRRLYKDAGLGDQGALLAAVDTLVKLGNDYPMLDPSFDLDEKTGQPKFRVAFKKPDKDKDGMDGAGKDLTQKQMLDYTLLTGKPFADMNVEERTQALMNLSADRKSWVPLKGPDSKEYRGLIHIVDAAEELREMLPSSRQLKWFATSDEEARFKAKASNLDSVVLLERSGAAVGDQEEVRTRAFRAALGKLNFNNIAAIEELIDWYSGSLNVFETEKRIPPGQKEAMRRAVRGGVPLPSEEPDPSEFELLGEARDGR